MLDKKYFTKAEIMDLLCITGGQFEWHVSKLNIKHISLQQVMYFYTYQNLIDIYRSIYITKRIIILDSKMNYKKMKL